MDAHPTKGSGARGGVGRLSDIPGRIPPRPLTVRTGAMGKGERSARDGRIGVSRPTRRLVYGSRHGNKYPTTFCVPAYK